MAKLELTEKEQAHGKLDKARMGWNYRTNGRGNKRPK